AVSMARRITPPRDLAGTGRRGGAAGTAGRAQAARRPPAPATRPEWHRLRPEALPNPGRPPRRASGAGSSRGGTPARGARDSGGPARRWGWWREPRPPARARWPG